MGFSLGLSSMVLPLYLSEVAPDTARGKLIAWFVSTIAVGELTAAVLEYVLGRNWRLMLGIPAYPAIL